MLSIDKTGSNKDSFSVRSDPSDVDDYFRLMVESVVDHAQFMLDPQGRVVTWNPGAERIKLYRAEEIVGKHFSIFYPSEAVEDGLPERRLYMAAESGRDQEQGWRLRKGGERFWANTVITALHNSQGRLVGFGKVTRDLSEGGGSQQGLKTAYDQVNSILECTSDLIIKLDRKWNIVYGNSKAANCLPKLFIGKSYWACFPEACGTSLDHTLRQAMSDGGAASYEMYYPLCLKWYRGNIFPGQDGITIFFRDVTAEKTAQEEVDRAHLLKEKRIEALSHMAGGLAHEITNPLAIIHGKASLLRNAAATTKSMSSEEVGKTCDCILKTTDRAVRILRGLSGFGRDAVNDPIKAASLCEIVEGCIELQGDRFERLNVKLRVHIEPGMPPIECREIQVGQIITNLLNNALDAVVKQSPDQRWVTLSSMFTRDQLQLEVTDSGPEIEENTKAHLMEPFFTTKEFGRGMGIGLSLSRAIAQDHGGSLRLCADSEHTCFRLTLPMRLNSSRSLPN